MGRWLTLPSLLLGLALLMAAGLGYLAWGAWQAYQEGQNLAARAQRAAQAVQETRAQEAQRREDLQRLESAPPPVSLPGEEEARALPGQVADLAQRYALRVQELRVSWGTLGGQEEAPTSLPVARIRLQVEGTEEGLLALLRWADGMPTAVVEALEFQRPLGGGEWRLLMSVRVAYRAGS